jgi:hypothetical protein
MKYPVWKVMLVGISALGFLGLIGTAHQARADRGECGVGFQRFSLEGFQANSTSPLTVRAGESDGGATWSHLYGPIAGSTVGSVQANQSQAQQTAMFSGASCQLEYSQDQFSANGGKDTFTADVYSTSCLPSGQPGLSLKNGMFNIVSGTALYQNLIGGGGNIQVSSRADGSVTLHLAGNLIAQGDSYRQF